MSRPQICLSTAEYPPTPGGVAVAAARLAGYLSGAGYGVHVVTAGAGSNGREQEAVADEDGVSIHRLGHPDPTSAEGLFAYRQLLQRLDEEVGFSLFHGFFLTAAYPCVLAAGRPPHVRPVIASIRGNDVVTLLDQPLCRAMLLPVLRKATWITSVNAAYLARVAEETDIAGRSSVIRSGVAQADNAVRWQLTEANRGTVGTIGEFRKVKDIPLLVRAYAAVPASLRRRLLLAGFFNDDEEEAWTNALIDEFGLRAGVEVTGRFPHAGLDAHLSRMHIYVQSSAHEGLPNALLEAAAAGIPLVATAVGGMQEVLTNGVTGLMVPHGDPQAMADAMTRVLEDDQLAGRLSDGARTLAAELTPDRERDQWLALYGKLLNRT